jgi:sn1-specific diacylglycerol lipase
VSRLVPLTSATGAIDYKAVIGDNCWRSHEAALHEFLITKNQELIYANFTNTIADRPYAIFADHAWRTIVITIRGTLSLEDLMTDANTQPVRDLRMVCRGFG